MKLKASANIFLCAILLLLGGFVSCKSKKQVLREPVKPKVDVPVTNDPMQNLIERILAARNTGQALSYTAEVDYKDQQQDIHLTMEVSARRDKYIFLTAKAMGFVNVARVMIQPDSIRIIDLINRRYISASFRYLRNYSAAPLSFSNLQNMVWAAAAFDPQRQSLVDSAAKPMKLSTTLGEVIQHAFYDDARRTEHFFLYEPARSRSMVVRYLKLTEMDGFHYPRQIVINIEGEKNLECKFAINNFAGIIHKEPQFVVPRTYKVSVY